jgi:hypothetical protein
VRSLREFHVANYATASAALGSAEWGPGPDCGKPRTIGRYREFVFQVELFKTQTELNQRYGWGPASAGTRRAPPGRATVEDLTLVTNSFLGFNSWTTVPIEATSR